MDKKAPSKTGEQSPQSTIYPEHPRATEGTHSAEPPSYGPRHDSFAQTQGEADEPPAYGEVIGQIENEQEDVGTRANVADDGRVNIHINQKGNRLATIFESALQRQPAFPPRLEPYVPPSLGQRADLTRPPKLNVVIHVVGSRGDVQPFVALGKVLKQEYGHRVRLATHPVFRDFVGENGLEFFNIGGDPSELMAFMVKNPGLMPGFDTLRNGDVGHRRQEIARMVKGCWRSCIESGDGTGPVASDESIDDWASTGNANDADAKAKPFVADCIIANPPSFAHIHCAEKLSIPLHMMFTMPWSPTQSFPHPLANIQSSNADASMTNFMSYALVDMMTWQGLGDVINRFRRKSLALDPISLTWAPGMLARMKIPYTYCWSPALIPKPRDWQQHISISGFYFLNLASNYQPAADLKAFLDAGPPPVYIGFGSIVVDDPNAMTNLIFEAVKQTGQRALVSKGWGGFGAEDLTLPDGVFMLGNVPHDWLFERVSAVVHHGGAGTTAAGISAGKPTVIVPFFGDQPFWGAMVHKAGAGPAPIPSKKLTADALAAGIQEALSPACVEKAKEMKARISKERGSETGAEYFHQELDLDKMRCQLSPDRAAVWRIRRTDFRLSAFAATVLAHEKLLDFKDLKLYRSRELDLDEGPWDPISGGAGALVGTMGSMAMGIADMPVATLKALKIHPAATKKKTPTEDQTGEDKGTEAPRRSNTDSEKISSADLSRARTEALQSVEPRHRRSSSASSSSSSKSGKEGQEAAAAHAMLGAAAAQQQQPPTTNTAAEKQKPFSFNKEDMETMLSTGKGAWRFTEAGVKSPLDFTLALAKGFHNAPKLYGDETVRKQEKVTDFQSGLKAAGKEFGFGLFDGISGLVTQPLRGAKKEGAAGFVKGVGKGIGGITLKPAAGFWAIPGFAAQGMYREIRNRFGPSVEGYIIAARTAQGYEEMAASSSEEYSQLIKDWDDIRKDLKKKKYIGEEKFEEIKGRCAKTRNRSRSASLSKKEAAAEKEPVATEHPLRHAQTFNDTATATDPEGPSERTAAIHDTVAKGKAPAHEPAREDDEFEAAIRESVKATSNGDPDEDAAIEAAIRASVRDLEAAKSRGADTKEIEATLQRSLLEARSGKLSRGDADARKKEKGRRGSNSPAARKLGVDDEGLKRALAESKAAAPSGSSNQGNDPSRDDDETLQRAIAESKAAAHSRGVDIDDEEELKRAMTESLKAHEERSKEIDEEEVVMRYVMRQSEAEEKARRQREGAGEASET